MSGRNQAGLEGVWQVSSFPGPCLPPPALTAQVAVSRGCKTSIRALGSPQPHLQQPLLRTRYQAKPRSVGGDEAVRDKGVGDPR